ncbi:hypothetical protein GGX14DRAFT_318698, partial [Mycena pura]
SSDKKKRGNKGNFQGKRLEWLKSRVSGYNAYTNAKKKKKRGSGQSFWDQTIPDYFNVFPWRLPREQDPLEVGLEEYAREPENEDERKQQEEILEDTENVSSLATLMKKEADLNVQKIIWWFSRQRATHVHAQDPFKPMLKKLRIPETATPRRIPDYQFYMAHDEFKGKVAKEFAER